MLLKKLDDKITDITPVYENNTLGGHFRVEIGTDAAFQLSFTSFLKSRFEENEKLKKYVRTRCDASSITASGIVEDLYSIGCPIELWVEDYFTSVRLDTQYDALLQLFNHLKGFNDDDTEY